VNDLTTTTAYRTSTPAWRWEKCPGREALSAPSNAGQEMIRLSFERGQYTRNKDSLSTIPRHQHEGEIGFKTTYKIYILVVFKKVGRDLVIESPLSNSWR
jgi:hypothetical protein